MVEPLQTAFLLSEIFWKYLLSDIVEIPSTLTTVAFLQRWSSLLFENSWTSEVICDCILLSQATGFSSQVARKIGLLQIWVQQLNLEESGRLCDVDREIIPLSSKDSM